MLWALFCWKTLGPGIHVDVFFTCTNYINIVTDQVHPFMATVFPNASGLFQQDNAPGHCKNCSGINRGTWQRTKLVSTSKQTNTFSAAHMLWLQCKHNKRQERDADVNSIQYYKLPYCYIYCEFLSGTLTVIRLTFLDFSLQN